MHEWALAEAVVATLDRICAENHGRRVRSVEVGLGELQRIAMDAFETGLDAFLAGRPYGREVFRFREEPASFRCNRCSREWPLASLQGMDDDTLEAIHFLPESAHVYLRCPSCGSPDFSLEKGRGVIIRSVELETDAD